MSIEEIVNQRSVPQPRKPVEDEPKPGDPGAEEPDQEEGGEDTRSPAGRWTSLAEREPLEPVELDCSDGMPQVELLDARTADGRPVVTVRVSPLVHNRITGEQSGGLWVGIGEALVPVEYIDQVIDALTRAKSVAERWPVPVRA